MPDADDVVPEGDVYKVEMLHAVQSVGRATLDSYQADVREVLDHMYLKVERDMHRIAGESERVVCGDIQFTIRIDAGARCAPAELDLTAEQRQRIADDYVQTIIVAPRDVMFR